MCFVFVVVVVTVNILAAVGGGGVCGGGVNYQYPEIEFHTPPPPQHLVPMDTPGLKLKAVECFV